MTYRYVKLAAYSKKDPERGSLISIQCKLCGTIIGDTVDRVVGYEKTASGQFIKVVRRQFTRTANYTEIKMQFDDGTFHVTHGCSSCLTLGLAPDVLKELYAADQEESPDGYTGMEQAKTPLGIVVLKHGEEGIV